jgi:hypothetical protein
VHNRRDRVVDQEVGMIQALYRTLDDWLVDQDADIRASEIQGLLAGLLAASGAVKPEEYAGSAR